MIPLIRNYHKRCHRVTIAVINTEKQLGEERIRFINNSIEQFILKSTYGQEFGGQGGKLLTGLLCLRFLQRPRPTAQG